RAGFGYHTPRRRLASASSIRSGRVILPMSGENAAPDTATAVQSDFRFLLLFGMSSGGCVLPYGEPRAEAIAAQPMLLGVKVHDATGRPGAVIRLSSRFAAAQTMS